MDRIDGTVRGVDGGQVSSPAAVGTNVLYDSSKGWASNAHRNRLVKITSGAGVGQVAVIASNAAQALVIKQPWARALDAGSTYQILDTDISSEFISLKEALSRVLEVSEDTGNATGGTNNTAVDITKNWAVDMWLNATVHVIHGGIEYVRLCSGNTADTLAITALPVGIAVENGDPYTIRRPITVADVSDRAARLLGVVYGSQGQKLLQRAATFDLVAQLRHAGVEIDPRAVRALNAADIVTVESLTKWGGVALTGRDVSLDLANLNISLSALRDAITAPAPNARTLNDLNTQLASILARNIAQIGGTAQTGADWTPLLQRLNVDLSSRASEVTLASVLAKLDITLSALRDAICAAAPNARTLNDLYGYLARYAQLPTALTIAGNLKQSVEEQAIALGIDVQARYPLKTIRDIAPVAVGTFWLPDAGSIDLSNFLASSWFVYAPTTANMTVDCYLNISHDGGVTFRRAEGYSIANADFVRDRWNSIHCPLMLTEAKFEVVVGTAFPVELDLMCIRKA